MNRSRGTSSQPFLSQQMFNSKQDLMNRSTAAGASLQTPLLLPCLSCKEYCTKANVGTCIDCYEEATETKQVLKKEIEELKSEISFLRLPPPSSVGFTDVVLVAIDELQSDPLPLPAHKAVLASRSPVFKAMLEIEMEDGVSGTINITDVSYDALQAFINYLYTAEANLDEKMACDLLVLAEKYEVKHLKSYCEKFLVSKLNWDNSVVSYSFAHKHHAKHLLESALSMIIENMDSLTKSEEYARLVEKDPGLVIKIYEAYMLNHQNSNTETTTISRRSMAEKTPAKKRRTVPLQVKQAVEVCMAHRAASMARKSAAVESNRRQITCIPPKTATEEWVNLWIGVVGNLILHGQKCHDPNFKRACSDADELTKRWRQALYLGDEEVVDDDDEDDDVETQDDFEGDDDEEDFEHEDDVEDEVYY